MVVLLFGKTRFLRSSAFGGLGRNDKLGVVSRECPFQKKQSHPTRTEKGLAEAWRQDRIIGKTHDGGPVLYGKCRFVRRILLPGQRPKTVYFNPNLEALMLC